MGLGKYVLKNGAPVAEPDLLKWAAEFEQSARTVERTEVGGVRVSTVFLGIDHNFEERGPAFLFETMIFGGKRDQEQHRYATLGEAKAGHFKIVDELKAGTTEPI